MIKLTCPKCGHSWNYKGNHYRAQCKSCWKKGITTWINTGIKKASKGITKKASPSISDEVIADSVLSGEIIEAIKQRGIDPKKKGGDNIPILLQNEELELALAKASRERKRSPERIIRDILKKWLKEGGYYDGK